MAHTTRRGTVAKKIRRGPGKRMVDGKSFRLADEVRYIQRRAAEHDERVVSFGQIVAFYTASVSTRTLFDGVSGDSDRGC